MRSCLSNFLTLLSMYHITFYALMYNTLYYITSLNFTYLHFIYFTLLQINFHYITYFHISLLCFTLLITTLFRCTIYNLNSSRSSLSNHKSRVFKTGFLTLTILNREVSITGLTKILCISFTTSQSSQYRLALAL